MKEIFDVCDCIPEYVPKIREIITDSNARACNFYEHATCVSYVHRRPFLEGGELIVNYFWNLYLNYLYLKKIQKWHFAHL